MILSLLVVSAIDSKYLHSLLDVLLLNIRVVSY